MPEHLLFGEAKCAQLMDQFLGVEGLFPLQQFRELGKLFQPAEEGLVVPEG